MNYYSIRIGETSSEEVITKAIRKVESSKLIHIKGLKEYINVPLK